MQEMLRNLHFVSFSVMVLRQSVMSVIVLVCHGPDFENDTHETFLPLPLMAPPEGYEMLKIHL